MKSLKNKNRLIFMSSHILSEVADICDEVADNRPWKTSGL